MSRLSHFRAVLEHESVLSDIMSLCKKDSHLSCGCVAVLRAVVLSFATLHRAIKVQGQPIRAGEVSLEKLLFQPWSLNPAPLIEGWSSFAVHHPATSSLAKPVPFIKLCD